MKGIHLNKPKKIHSDNDVSIFRDANGHEIRVAHSALSPKMLKELQSLPVHGKEPKKMADGGDASDDDSNVDDKAQSVSSVDQEPQAQTQGNAPLDVEPIQPGEDNGSEDQSQTQDQEDQVDSSQEIPAPSADQQQPQAQQSPTASIISNPLDAGTIANQLNTNYAQFKQDYGSGQIQPKTLADLWSKKADGTDRGTLSKIGMFFSMLASGMGSGLTHQPNMLLQAMQKQIDNDLAAQQNTKTNQFNAWNAANQHVQTLSNLNLQNLQAKLVQAQAANLPVEAKRYESEIAVNKANASLLATNQARQALVLGVLQHTLGQVNKMPPGPMKTQAMEAHQVLSQAADAHAVQQNQQTAQQIENNWRQHNMALSLAPETQGLAQYQAERHVPFVGDTSVPLPQNVREQINAQQILDNKGQDLLSFIDQHKGLDLNRWNPQDRAVAAQKVEELKNFYNDSIGGGALTQGRLGWYDEQFGGDKKNPLDILPQMLGQTAKFKEMVNSNRARMNQTLRSYGAPIPESATQQSSSEPQKTASNEGTEITTKSGKKAIWRNGQLFYK